jgi:hypothetical protein
MYAKSIIHDSVNFFYKIDVVFEKEKQNKIM